MKRMFLLGCFLLFPFFGLISLEVISFDHLDSRKDELQGQEIALRGFLYRSGDAQWILSSEPNLRSCCVGSEKKKKSQVVVTGDLPQNPSSRAMLIQGMFNVDRSEKDNSFRLKKASIIEEETSTGILLVIGLIGVSVLLFWILLPIGERFLVAK